MSLYRIVFVYFLCELFLVGFIIFFLFLVWNFMFFFLFLGCVIKEGNKKRDGIRDGFGGGVDK